MKLPTNVSLLARGVAVAALLPLLACPPTLHAQTTTTDDTHLVSPSDLQQQVQSASETRQKNIETVTNFLSVPGADQAMKDAHLDPNQVRQAVPTLSDAELANLSARATHAQQQFAAGLLGLGWLLTIVVIIAIIIIIATLA
jgi:glutamyl-tRNA reductase